MAENKLDQQQPIVSPLHKTLPKYSLQIRLISIRFYEMGDTYRQAEVCKKDEKTVARTETLTETDVLTLFTI